MLTKSDFYAQFAAGPKVHEVPGTAAFVREMGAHERSQYELSMKDDMVSCRERLVVLCLCDETGVRLLDDSEVSRVGQLPASAIEPIFRKAREVNGFDAKPVEEIRKNSESNPSDV